MSLIISALALYQSCDSNSIAQESNEIDMDANSYEIKLQSNNLAGSAYDEIYKDEINKLVLDKISRGENINEYSNLLRFVDIFESIGASFCDGRIFRKDIRTNLSNSLFQVCNSEQIYYNFADNKNGTAMLCSALFPESIFASTIDLSNVGSCTFLDQDNLFIEE